MRIVVLDKPVPDPASRRRAPRPGRPARPGRRARRSSTATTSTCSRRRSSSSRPPARARSTLLSMAPPTAPETLRKALAMGATRGVLVTDPALEGSCARVDGAGAGGRARRARVRPRPGRRRHLRRRRRRRSRPAVARPARPAVPVLRREDRARQAARTVRVRRISPTGYDLLEAPMPAVIGCTQALGEPRYPSLKGIMAARSKEIVTRSLADLGLDGASVGGAVATTKVARHAAAAGARGDRGRSRHAPTRRGPDRRVPRRAEDHLMAAAVGRRGAPARRRARPDQHRGRDARPRARRPRAGTRSAGSWSPREPERPPRSSPAIVPLVLTVADPAAADHAWSAVAAAPARGADRGREQAPTRMSSSSVPGPTAATSPGPCPR